MNFLYSDVLLEKGLYTFYRIFDKKIDIAFFMP